MGSLYNTVGNISLMNYGSVGRRGVEESVIS